MQQSLTAEEAVKLFGLQPHPEGGYFKETLRTFAGEGGRSLASLIYFLLPAGQVSHWHRVDAVEVWIYNAGAPVELSIAEKGKPIRKVVVGPQLEKGQTPQGEVPVNAWQSAVSTGDWSLVSCMVSPGFQFEGFELAPKGWVPTEESD